MHVTVAAGASDAAPAGQVAADRVPDPLNAPSAIVTPLMVWLPVLVTRNEYVSGVPTALALVGDTDLARDSDGDADTLSVAVEPGEVTVDPDGDVPVATALFTTAPASTSA